MCRLACLPIYMFISMSLALFMSLCPSVHLLLSLFLLLCGSVGVSRCISFPSFVSFHLYLSVCLSICLSLSVSLSLSLSLCLSLSLSLSLSLCLSVCLSISSVFLVFPFPRHSLFFGDKLSTTFQILFSKSERTI